MYIQHEYYAPESNRKINLFLPLPIQTMYAPEAKLEWFRERATRIFRG